MKKTIVSLTFLGLAGAASAANIAGTGTGIQGTHTTIDSTLGTSYIRGDQDITNLFDGVKGTNGVINGTVTVDTWGFTQNAGGPANGLDYVGVTGLVIPAGEEITSLTYNMLSANDGGWFGTTGNNSTGAAELTVPTVQITSDGGTSWSILANTNDYMGVMTNSSLGATYNDVTFDFAGQTGINGIRLIGESAGSGDSSTGFIGGAEFEVNTTPIPEPGSSALLGLAGLALILRRRK